MITSNSFCNILSSPKFISALIKYDQMCSVSFMADFASLFSILKFIIFLSFPYFLSIYCLLFFLVGLGYPTLTSLFNGLGETRITLKISLITLLLILTLSPLLIMAYGVSGSLAALICAHATSTCYGMYIAKRNFKIEFDTKSLIKIYLIGAGSTVPSLLLLQVSTLPRLVNVLVGGMLYLAIYVTLAPTTKIVNNSELETVTEIVQKIKPLTPIIKPLIEYQKKILNRQESPTKSS